MLLEIIGYISIIFFAIVYNYAIDKQYLAFCGKIATPTSFLVVVGVGVVVAHGYVFFNIPMRYIVELFILFALSGAVMVFGNLRRQVDIKDKSEEDLLIGTRNQRMNQSRCYLVDDDDTYLWE